MLLLSGIVIVLWCICRCLYDASVGDDDAKAYVDANDARSDADGLVDAFDVVA